MSIRITGGELRSRIVPSPVGGKTRPTSSIARQALFNILQDIQDAQVLDLYCGSGIMGIEALSRGAAHVHAVENSKEQGKLLQKTYQDLNVSTRISLHNKDVMDLLRHPWPHTQAFDLIYADPPFTLAYPDLQPFCAWLAPHGTAIFEAPSRSLPVWAAQAFDQRRYGESTLLFFHHTC